MSIVSVANKGGGGRGVFEPRVHLISAMGGDDRLSDDVPGEGVVADAHPYLAGFADRVPEQDALLLQHPRQATLPAGAVVDEASKTRDSEAGGVVLPQAQADLLQALTDISLEEAVPDRRQLRHPCGNL